MGVQLYGASTGLPVAVCRIVADCFWKFVSQHVMCICYLTDTTSIAQDWHQRAASVRSQVRKRTQTQAKYAVTSSERDPANWHDL